MLLYSLLHLTGLRPSRSTTCEHFRQWGSRTPGHPEYGLHRRRRDDHRPARPGLRATPSAWRSPSASWRRTFNGAGPTSSTTAPTCIAGDGDMMEGVSQRGGVARRAPQARQAHRPLRRQPHHHRRLAPTSPSPRTWATRFEAYGWHVQRVATATTSRPSTRRSPRPRPSTDRPSLIVVRTHIGFGSPNKQDTAERARRAARRGRGQADQGEPRLAARADLLRARRRRARSTRRRRSAARRRTPSGASASRPSARPTRTARAQWDDAWPRELPDGWDADLPVFEPEDGAVGDPRRVGQGPQRAGAAPARR